MIKSRIDIVLEGLNAEHLIPIFKENDIDLNTLSQLTKSDLICLGIEDEILCKNILKHGESQNKQYCKNQYKPFTNLYTKNMILDINRHLLKLESNLLMSYIRLNRTERPLDPLVSPNLHASEAVLKSMKITSKSLTCMEKELQKLETNLKKIKIN